MSGFLQTGFTINLNEIDAELAYYVSYYDELRRKEQKQEDFKALFEILKKTRGM